MIIRDSVGDLVLAFYKYVARCEDPFEAGLLADKEGIQAATTYATGQFVLQTDCWNMIKTLKNLSRKKSRIGHLVREVKKLFMEESGPSS